MGYSLWGRKELDTTERLPFTSHSQPDALTSPLSVHFALYPDPAHTTPGPPHTASQPLSTIKTHLLTPACSPGLPALQACLPPCPLPSEFWPMEGA